MKFWYVYKSYALKVGKPIPDWRKTLSSLTGIPQKDLLQAQIAKQSLDARHRIHPKWLFQIEFSTQNELEQPLPKGVTQIEGSVYEVQKPAALAIASPQTQKRAIVVGTGPAGLFAALALGEAGVKTTVIERGKPVETRMKDIGLLRGRGILNSESNVCFGEGGAGTYTDGKLYTRVKHPFLSWVMTKLVEFGGPERILYDAHPHLGTDKLVRIIVNMRNYLQEIGVNIHFQTRIDEILVHKGRACGVRTSSGLQMEAESIVLAIGHSARETLEHLHSIGVAMSFKDFSLGVRVEHPQELINKSQYGRYARIAELGAAEYRLAYQAPDPHLGKRGVYSFCMCPGGFVVPTPTEPGRMAINGMSNANRSTPFANSGIVVQVTKNDLLLNGYEDHPLMGIQFQRELEERTFKATEMSYASPAMRITDFINRKEPKSLAPTRFRPKAEPYPLTGVLPPWITDPLRAGLSHFGKKIKGYASSEGNLFGIESRTSSPVRLERSENLQSISLAGLFPVGEGAGYAGGIVSAAIDGLKAARQIISPE
ncbi:MAG: hypothetical protein CR997_04950 [Acidobacteria bacterium]|nr:MAG: hypothetical protein CR997_04950 [Acidobacteriota bacterium]